MSKFHVDQIANFLRTAYAPTYERSDLDEVNNLSRYLGVYSLDLTLGDDPSAAQRLVEVTDGGRDRGIDAIAVDPVRDLLVLSQSKFRQDGTGGMEVGECLRFVEGVRSLLGARNTGEPVHASPELRAAVRELLITPSARIQLVTVSTGNQQLSAEVLQPISALLSEMNDLEGVDPIMTHVHLGQAELFTSLTGSSRQAIDLEVDLLNWGGGTADPLRILYGKVSGADIAQWYHEHETDLFAENIRVVIPRSEINAGMAETVKNSPERFGYYNNGIVILADSIAHSPGGLLNRDVLRVALNGASVVNGAQTVSTLGSLLGTEWEQNLSQVFVLTRCIEVPADDATLARGITRYANTQNEVSSQDFSFLDEQQHRLARELLLLGYEYVIRQAEQPTADDPSKIIFLRDAAVALACADADITLSITAKREVSRLFSQSGNEYKRLFNAATDPLVLQRSVMILRRSDSLLDAISAEATGVELGVAVHGRLVVAHLALMRAGLDSLKDPSWDIAPTLADLPSFVAECVSALASVFPDNSYPGNVFKNKSRTEELLVAAGLPSP
ncbi:MAG: AIPR family protein [Salinibacterium sp.]|nr:AIPR family protein [Salinibacterium sp.]MBF0672734.1 AIPR family protein [Salinibacterium sp.]